MPVSSMKELLEAGVHFGHHTRKWNPKMRPYIYGERNDIYIIDLHKTRKKLEESYEQVRQMAFNGNTFLFVGTKKQAQDAIQELKARGFSDSELGLLARHTEPNDGNPAEGESEAGTGAVAGVAGALAGMGVSKEEAAGFEKELESGKTLVSVTTATRWSEAVAVLRDRGGDVRLPREGESSQAMATSQSDEQRAPATGRATTEQPHAAASPWGPDQASPANTPHAGTGALGTGATNPPGQS